MTLRRHSELIMADSEKRAPGASSSYAMGSDESVSMGRVHEEEEAFQ